MWGVLVEYALSLTWAYVMLAIMLLWAIGSGQYDAVAVELDPQRLQALTNPDALAQLDIGVITLGCVPIKSVRRAIEAGDKAAAQAVFAKAVSVIDSIADKRIVHKNKSSRHKSRLSAQIKALAA